MLNERMKARNDKKNVLQSERIEHVDYVIENNIKIDYLFLYFTSNY